MWCLGKTDKRPRKPEKLLGFPTQASKTRAKNSFHLQGLEIEKYVSANPSFSQTINYVPEELRQWIA